VWIERIEAAIFPEWLNLPEFPYRLPSQGSQLLVLQFTRHFSQGVIHGSLAGIRLSEINQDRKIKPQLAQIFAFPWCSHTFFFSPVWFLFICLLLAYQSFKSV
jgi:hypothetical protein